MPRVSEPSILRRIGALVLALVLCSPMGCARTYVVTKKRLEKLEPQQTTKDEVVKIFGQPDSVEPRTPAGETLVYVQRKRSFVQGGVLGAAVMGLYWGLAGLAFAGGPAGLVVVPPAMLLGGAVGVAGGSILVKDISALRVHLNAQQLVEHYEVVQKKRLDTRPKSWPGSRQSP